MYLQQICLAALFFLARDQDLNASAIPEGALMIVLIAFTAFFHLIINNSYGPLTHYLPLTLAEMAHGKKDGNVNAAAQELDQEASVHSIKPEQDKEAAEATATETRSVRKRPSVPGSIDEFPVPGKRPEQRDTDRPSIRSANRDADADLEAGVAPKEQSETSIRGVDEDVGPKDFYHPASVEAQPVVWLPRDSLGLADAEEKACRDVGVNVSTKDAVMDGKGRVEISGPPPDVVIKE